MGVTKNQHYVSQGILKHFADENKKIYEIFIREKIISKKSIASTMAQNYVYEHPQIKKNALENIFAKVENYTLPIIDKMLVDIENNYAAGKSCEVYYDEINKIISFILMFYFRSGALLHEYEAFSDNPKLDRVERLLLNIFDVKYISGLCQTIMSYYDWAIIYDEQERFLISDQYLSTVALKFKNRFSNASNRQIGMKDTMILLPLSAKFYIIFYSGRIPHYIIKNKFNLLSERAVKEFNNVIYQNSYVKCAGKTKDEIDRVKDIDMCSPVKSLLKYNDGTIKDLIIKREVFFYDEDKDLEKNYINYAKDYNENIKGKIKRNDACICGSGKKYKKCCMMKYEAIKDIIYATKNPRIVSYCIPGVTVSERSIIEFEGLEQDLNSKDREILDWIEKSSPHH